ncbi:MAG: glycosyltransferase family 2 protein [Eubacterium sp.]|nr:glycosyltransferase family 2 protein [Eubacterium sp.]
MKELISIVIPCYNSESTISDVVGETQKHLKEKLSEYNYEFILINDCSKDNTIGVLSSLCEKDERITAIDFAKNFGQHAALLAGFREAQGDYVVCLDDDGQMPIESICEMIEALKGDIDVVQGRYQKTKQSLFRRLGSKVNALMAEMLINKPKELEMNSFWGAKKYVIKEIAKYEGPYPYIAGLILRTTSKIANIDVKHRARTRGNSGYTLFGLIKLWMNGFTAFSVIPLRIATYSGMICAILGFIMGIVEIIRKIMNPAMTMGYASTITIILFIGGMIMMMLGIIGEYVGRTYISINRAPQYVVKRKWDKRDGI